MSIPSPCIRVCSLDEVRRICVGCGRTLEEIASWSRLDEAQRQEIEARSQERLAGLGMTIDNQSMFPDARSSATPAR